MNFKTKLEKSYLSVLREAGTNSIDILVLGDVKRIANRHFPDLSGPDQKDHVATAFPWYQASTDKKVRTQGALLAQFTDKDKIISFWVPSTKNERIMSQYPFKPYARTHDRPQKPFPGWEGRVLGYGDCRGTLAYNGLEAHLRVSYIHTQPTTRGMWK